LRYAARRASRVGQIPKITISQSQQSPEKPAEWMTFGESDAFWLPGLDDAINRDDDVGVNKAVLKFFFEEHDPTRVQEVDQLLAANAGREETLFVELSAQYPEPSLEVAFAMVDADKKVEESQDWASFDDEPILNGMRRPTGVWAVNYSPWQE